MQRPTHPRLHVRDARDAHTVFEAVRLGYLQRVERRLNEIERSMYIRSGAIFVWEECDDDLGLKRWTDGRIWSQSRMREPYLFYDERLPSEQQQANNEQTPRSPTYRFVDGASRSGSTSSAMSHYDRSNNHPMGLVKQAYSAWVQLAPNTKPKKWHLTAYFTYSDLQHIPTIDHDPILQRIAIPPGVYKSGKARSRNSVSYGDDHGSNGPQSPPPSHSPSPTPMPGNMRYAVNQAGNRSAAHGQVAYPQGYPDSTGPRSSTPRPGNASPPPTLPPIRTAIPELHPSSSWGQVPRPAEDQRLIQMLNSRPFR